MLFVDVLGFPEIGGVGEMCYHMVRFPKYELQYSGTDTLLCPLYFKDSVVTNPKDNLKMTGQALLASLCNLYRKINDPSNDEPLTDLIVHWCVSISHPYQIDWLYEQLTHKDYEYVYFSSHIMRDGIFDIKTFLYDLENLYHTTCFYQALLKLKSGDDSYARTLYHEGKLSDGYPFFEKFKVQKTHAAMPDASTISREDLLKEMKAQNKVTKRQNEPDRDAKDRPFLQNPIEDYSYLETVLLGLFPEFRMKLRRDPRTNRIQFAADVHSVFDLAWYTLSRCVAHDAPKEDEDMYSLFREMTILSCLNCGDFFVRRGPRQVYCNKWDCQAARKRKNRRDCDARKRSELLK